MLVTLRSLPLAIYRLITNSNNPPIWPTSPFTYPVMLWYKWHFYDHLKLSAYHKNAQRIYCDVQLSLSMIILASLSNYHVFNISSKTALTNVWSYFQSCGKYRWYDFWISTLTRSEWIVTCSWFHLRSYGSKFTVTVMFSA